MKSPKYLSGSLLLWHLLLPANFLPQMEVRSFTAWQGSSHYISFYLFVWWLYCVDPKLCISKWWTEWLADRVSKTRGASKSNFFQFDCLFLQASSTYYAWIQLKLFCVLLHITLKKNQHMYKWCLYVEMTYLWEGFTDMD